MVNSIEKQLVQVAWEEWMQAEVEQCEPAGKLLGRTKDQSSNATVASDTESIELRLQKYCSSCKAAERHVSGEDSGADYASGSR